MAKQSGLGDNFYIDGVDVSGDIASLQKIGGGPATLDVTGINKSAFQRIGGKRDGGMEFTSYFNPDGVHPVLSALPTSDVIVTYFRGSTLGGPAAACVGKQVTYDGNRDEDGGFKFECSLQANGYGIEWGIQGTDGIRNDTSATSGNNIDCGASGAYGLQAYLQVFDFTGTSVTVKLQDSPDESTWTDVTGGAFAAATGPSSQRLATADDLAVDRYLRVVTTGTFSDVSFAVVIVRNDTGVTF